MTVLTHFLSFTLFIICITIGWLCHPLHLHPYLKFLHQHHHQQLTTPSHYVCYGNELQEEPYVSVLENPFMNEEPSPRHSGV